MCKTIEKKTNKQKIYLIIYENESLCYFCYDVMDLLLQNCCGNCFNFPLMDEVYRLKGQKNKLTSEKLN